MLASLLSIVAAVPAPRFNNMGTGNVRVFLWSDDDHITACAGDDPGPLWNFICMGTHPAYTFEVDDAFDASVVPHPVDAMAAAVSGFGCCTAGCRLKLLRRCASTLPHSS
jgi:hypothetical protein